jgi:hypothetical protein
MGRAEPQEADRDAAEIDGKIVIEQDVGLADMGAGEQFPVGLVARPERLDQGGADFFQLLLLHPRADHDRFRRKPVLTGCMLRMGVGRGEKESGAFGQPGDLVRNEGAVAPAKPGVDHQRCLGSDDDGDVGIAVDDKDMGRQRPGHALLEHDVVGLLRGMILCRRCRRRDDQRKDQTKP